MTPEADEVGGHQRGGRRGGVVGVGARPDDERLGVVGGEEIARAIGVPVVAPDGGGEALGVGEPVGIEGGLVQGEGRLGHGGVVGGKAREDRLAVARGMGKASGPGHGGGDEAEGGSGEVYPVGAGQRRAPAKVAAMVSPFH